MVFMCDCTTGKWGIYPSGGKHKKAIILGSPSLPNIYRELFCKSLGLSVLVGDIDKMKEKSNGKMINIIKASNFVSFICITHKCVRESPDPC